MASSDFDAKLLVERAEQNGKTYPMKAGWRKSQILAGVLCCFPLVPLFPLGLFIISRAKKAKVGITEEGFAFRYMGTVAGRWSDIESITLSSMNAAGFGGGLIGVAAAAVVSAKTQGLKGPLMIKMKGKRMPLSIPAQMIEGSMEMALEMERLSGITFLPKEQGSV
jgi:hypothetical protein